MDATEHACCGEAGNGSEVDPVCGMKVEPASAAGTALHQGRTYYFCSQHCVEKFRADPGRFLARRDTAGQASSGTPAGSYTCPMHPEIVQDHPGSCPKCGMALEPAIPWLAEGPNSELIEMQVRFWIALALSLPVFLIAMGGLLPWPALQHFLHAQMAALNWAQLLLATPVVLWCGWPFFQRARDSVVQRSWNMFTLIALGVGAAFVYSVLATVAPFLFPAGFRGMSGAVEPYFDSAAVIVTLVLLGQVMELRARWQTGSAIRALLTLTPKTTRIVREDGQDEDIPVEQVRPGDRLRILPGERLPVDGAVAEGRSAVDESLVRGESIPVEKIAGAKVVAGSMNGTGALVIEAQRVGPDTLLAQIVRMVAEAQRSRAPIEKLANRVAQYFVPVVLLIALFTFIGWGAWGPEPRLAHAFLNSVAVLIIACPCALGLATPMAIMVGTGRAAGAGVLFRDAEALETLRKCTVLVVDKTGTLTEGKPKLTSVQTAAGFSQQQLLSLAAGLETNSEHPLAAAISQGAQARGLLPTYFQEFQSVTGKGVVGQAAGKRVVVGNAALLEDERVDLAPLAEKADELRAAGETVMLVAIDGALAGLLAVVDPIKSTTPAAIGELQSDGLRIIMLTGDNSRTAGAVARQLRIDDVIAGALPAQKAEAVDRLQAEGHQVAMAGDGVNDAPAMAKANVGIAMGTGTDIAMHTAGVTLVKGDLRGILRARKISQQTTAAIWQNLLLAFLYNGLCVPLAALGWVSPMWASAAMSLSSVSVILNSLRLRTMKL